MPSPSLLFKFIILLFSIFEVGFCWTFAIDYFWLIDSQDGRIVSNRYSYDTVPTLNVTW